MHWCRWQVCVPNLDANASQRYCKFGCGDLSEQRSSAGADLMRGTLDDKCTGWMQCDSRGGLASIAPVGRAALLYIPGSGS